jgi:hypothetical protein
MGLVASPLPEEHGADRERRGCLSFLYSITYPQFKERIVAEQEKGVFEKFHQVVLLYPFPRSFQGDLLAPVIGRK